MAENFDQKLKRLQDERDSAKKEREDVEQELGEIDKTLKRMRDGQRKRQRQLDDDIKKHETDQKKGPHKTP
ncbi:MAG TPA: hypothetical protein V6C81_09480 [Planktothrix sp.]